jgi:hypothetical protein
MGSGLGPSREPAGAWSAPLVNSTMFSGFQGQMNPFEISHCRLLGIIKQRRPYHELTGSYSESEGPFGLIGPGLSPYRLLGPNPTRIRVRQ